MRSSVRQGIQFRHDGVSSEARLIEAARGLHTDGLTASERPHDPPPRIHAYRVQLVPLPMVINADGLPVANSHVVEIIFPGDVIETALGKVNTIVGPGIAKIIVDEMTLRGVPLC